MGNASEHFRLQLAPQVPREERERGSWRRKERKGGDAPKEMEFFFFVGGVVLFCFFIKSNRILPQGAARAEEQDAKSSFWSQLLELLVIFLLEGEVLAVPALRSWTPRSISCTLWPLSNGRC